MIKAIVMDVDGVVVGKQHGVNFPLPNKAVISRLKQLHKKGIPVVLCTAKFGYAVHGIIKQAELANPHITDNGALIIDLLDNNIVKEHILPKSLVHDIVTVSLQNGIYTECFTANDYFLQSDQVVDFTQLRAKTLQKPPHVVPSLVKKANETDVIKIICFAMNDSQKDRLHTDLQPFKDQIHLIWGRHPALAPAQAGVITMTGVSKKHATLEVLEYLGIPSDETLGMGDEASDWQFMSLCKYVGTVGRRSEELRDLAKTKGEGNYCLGGSVDDNGFLDIVNYFEL